MDGISQVGPLLTQQYSQPDGNALEHTTAVSLNGERLNGEVQRELMPAGKSFTKQMPEQKIRKSQNGEKVQTMKMLKDILSKLELNSSLVDDAMWQQLVTQEDPRLVIHQNRDSAFNFRLYGQLRNTTPYTVFDLLCDTENRHKWDDLIEESRVLKHIDAQTRIVYIRTKGIWPAQSRDLVLLSYMCKTNNLLLKDTLQDEWLINVTKSVNFPGMPPRTSESIIRMHCPLSGQIIRRKPMDPSITEIWQLIDGNPQGWVPSSLIQFVTSKAIPKSFSKLERLCQQGDQLIASRFLSDTPCVDIDSIDLESINDVIDTEEDGLDQILLADSELKGVDDLDKSIEQIEIVDDMESQASDSTKGHLEDRIVDVQGIQSTQRRRSSRKNGLQNAIEKAAPWLVLSLVAVNVTRLAILYKSKSA
ncbi:hypothetical protein MP228_004367 [Amoeboaphelidium protococcarum]|nr:hypothetical protein MP228_004367 [Amoeboaphelidium protococcarum]